LNIEDDLSEMEEN